MKFVYLGYDFMLPCVHRLINDGHELVGVFSFECDNIFNFNRNTLDLAQSRDVAFSIEKPLSIDIEAFISQGTEVFLSAGYPYKIPPIHDDGIYGLNVHPSLLPAGRGLMPTPSIIINHPEAAGLSIHKLSADFDDGDILYKRAFDLTELDDVETYSARISVIAPDILSEVFSNIRNLWDHAEKQDPQQASNFPIPDDTMRKLDWFKPVDDLMIVHRAFGRFGVLAHLEDSVYAVYSMNGWKEVHDYNMGTIVSVTSREVIVAAKDGFLVLKDMQKLEV